MQRDQAHRTNELLERIAVALEAKNKLGKLVYKDDGTVDFKPKDIPGFEGTLDALDNLYAPKDKYETDGTSVGNGKYEDESYAYETDLQGIRKDDDHDVRVAASCFEEDYATKKDAILDYVTNEFGILGARYTDIIKFAYYLGAPNAPKYDATRDRGYYSCAFATRYGGHLIQGGTNQLVKGINKEGKERYFALSEVDNFTDYYKRIA